MLGLVLNGGGARGAYHAGVLKRVGELRGLQGRPSPFRIVTGASSGAINAAMVATARDEVLATTQALAEMWRGLRVEQVFRTDPAALAGRAARLTFDLSLGGAFGGAGMTSFLDARPARALLERHLVLSRVREAIRQHGLVALALTATSYHSGRAFTFVEGAQGHALWQRRRRIALSVELKLEHVLASAAIPLVFQPVRVETPAGPRYFGDGGLRLVNPLSPAIQLGATRLLAIGVRCGESADALQRAELLEGELDDTGDGPRRPPIAQICGSLLNAIYLDHLDEDLDHLEHLNRVVASRSVLAPADGLRPISPLVIHPSEDLAIVATQHTSRMPRAIRHVLDGLGTPDAHSADLMSYLLFDASYTRELLDLGYRDADRRIDEIETWLCEDADTELRSSGARPAAPLDPVPQPDLAAG